MLRRWTGFATLVAALAAASPGAADDVRGTRFDVHERSHTIAARLERGHAVLVVTRVVENPGPKSDQAVFWLDVPHGAVATRLRTAGVAPSGAVTWFEGELMEAEKAAHLYEELTGVGGYYPKDPALLSWRSQERLALQVFPVPARGDKTVEYTLKLPMTYEEGGYTLKLDALGTEAQRASIRFAAAHPDDLVEINGVRVPPSATVTAGRDLEVRLVPRGAPPLDVALASFGFGKDRALVHARVAAAPRLTEPPARSSVVVLVDVSRSMDVTLPSALAAVNAYVAQLAGADVEVMTFARTTRSPFGGPLPAREALARMYGASFATENGSNLDEALARADAALARSSAPAKRIVLVTDLRTRAALTPEKVASRTLSSGAVVHVATVTAGAPSLTRDDDDAWAAVPRKTGGVLWRATIDSASDPTARGVFEEWVRPKRVDRLAVEGMPASFVAPASLAEGAALEHLAIEKAGVAQITLKGELWSRPVKVSAAPSAEEAKLWSALVFGSELQGELSDAEAMKLAMHGRAVSPVTSYLAIEPGVRPSTEGLEPNEGVGHGSAIGAGQGFGYGHGRLSGQHASRTDRQAFLDRALGAARDACQARGEAAATIEATLAEIVDVRDVALTPRDVKAEACVAERLWAVALTAAFDEEDADFRAKAPR